MKNRDHKQKNDSALRKRAEEQLKFLNKPLDNLSDSDVRKMVHELQVHQIELEMQNDELHKNQEVITESNRKYIELYNFAPVGYVVFNNEGKIRDANLKFCKMTGKERSFLINSLFIRLVVNEERDIFYRHLQQIFYDQGRHSCELRLEGERELAVQLDSEYIVETYGPSFCSTSITDITGKKNVEAELKKKVKELNVMADISNFLINVTSEDEIYSRIPQIISDNFEFKGVSIEIYNELTDEIVFVGSTGLKIDDNLPFKEPAEVTVSMDVIKTGMPVRVPDIENQSKYELHIYKMSGYKDFLCYPLRRIDSVIGTLCMASAKTMEINDHFDLLMQTIVDTIAQTIERKQTEKLLEKHSLNLEELVHKRTDELVAINNVLKVSEAKYVDLYNNALDMFLTVSAKTTNIIDCNETLTKVSGYTKEEIMNHPVTNLFHVDCLAEAEKAISLFKETGEVNDYELILRCKDGRKVDISINGSAVRDEQGNIIHSRSVWRDITVRKMVEKELTKTNEKLLHSEKLAAIGKLSASLSHEFNNPICGIRNTLESIVEIGSCKPLDDNLLKLVHLSIKELTRMAHLIKDLQDFNRPSSGIFISSIDINALIDEVILINKNLLKEKNIMVEKNYDVDIPQITVIPDQIKQVILNLIQNAEESIPETGGKITINTLHDDSNVLIQIKDSGAGIKKEFMSSIFEPFISSKPAVKGTGLGLSICYGILKKHGGDILVESEVGKGTIFTMTLPVKQMKERELK